MTVGSSLVITVVVQVLVHKRCHMLLCVCRVCAGTCTCVCVRVQGVSSLLAPQWSVVTLEGEIECAQVLLCLLGTSSMAAGAAKLCAVPVVCCLLRCCPELVGVS